MKKIIWMLAIYASVATLALPAFAKVIEASAQSQTAAQGQCTDESKAAWYADFTKNRTTDAAKAYEAAKKYLAACPTEEGPIPTYLKKWVGAYDKEARKLRLSDLFVNQRKYPEAMTLAKEIIADEPDNVAVLMDLGYGGYVLAVTTKNESGNAEAISYARKAIQLIESGKAPDAWSPFKSKDDALGYLYYSIGFLNRVTNPQDALTAFIKAAQFDSDVKKNPETYAFIAAAYENEYAKQSADYEVKHKGKDETPESKLAIANINQLVDRIIDALARAVAVAGSDAASQQLKTQRMARLTELYKFRHNQSDAGLTDLIASVLSKPLPPVPTPLTSLPSSSTITPSSGNSSSTSAPGAAGSTTSTSAAANLATPKTTTATKPAVTTTATTPAKPKIKNNHRRH
jgi:tetratricopeptide (TPR) repeat protein